MDDGIRRREGNMLQFGVFLDPLAVQCSVFDRLTHQTDIERYASCICGS